MKIFVLALAIISNLFPAPADTLKTADTYFLAGRYSEAQEKYEQVLRTGYENFAIYNNLGNCFYRKNKIAQAMIAYERALKLDPSNKDIIHNITLLKNQIPDKIEPMQKLFWKRWFNSLSNRQSINGWAVSVILIETLFLGFFISLIFVRRVFLRRMAFLGIIFSILLLLCSVVFLISQNAQMDNNREAVIVSREVPVRYSPDASSKNMFSIHEGLKVQILDQIDEWCKIQLEDGRYGWLLKSSIEVI
jgi:tetratricopeptide (TPR) repeat protein